MIDASIRPLIGFGAGLLATGIITGSFVLIACAAVPLVAFAWVIRSGTHHVSVQAPPESEKWTVGVPATLRIEYEVRGPPGLIEVHQPLPNAMELTEGTNLALVRKGLLPRRGRLTMQVRCPRRGVFPLEPLAWTAYGRVPAHEVASGTADAGVRVRVSLAAARFKRIPNPRGRGVSILPSGDAVRSGVQTTDFRDIREYQAGDRLASINWRATARQATALGPRGRPPPLVNEYEVEGRKRAWIFLDRGPRMVFGSEVENALEASIHAAAATARLLTDQGYRVGFSTFPGPLHLYPEAGSRQFHRIHGALEDLEPAEADGGLDEALLQARPFLRGARSAIFFITRAEALTQVEIETMREMRRHMPRGQSIPGVVLTPDAYELVPDVHELSPVARDLRVQLAGDSSQRTRTIGVPVIRWNPVKESLAAVLVRRLRL